MSIQPFPPNLQLFLGEKKIFFSCLKFDLSIHKETDVDESAGHMLNERSQPQKDKYCVSPYSSQTH